MYTLLLTLCISFISSSLHSMQQHAQIQHAALQADADGNVPMPQASADASGKDAKAAVEEAALGEQPLTVTLHIPMPTPKQLALNKEEPIALAPFKELVEAQAKEGDAFVLAHVELKTCDAHGKRHTNNYEAHSLLQSFGLSYPFPAITEQLRRLENAQGKSLLDPHKAPIHDITFYTYDPKQPKEGFVFLCSWSQLFAMDKNTSDALQLRLYANQNHDKKLKYTAIRKLGDKYFGNDEADANADLDKAHEYYMRLADQSIYPEQRIHACFRLGGLFYKKQNYTTACKFLTLVADQSIDETLQITACAMLAEIYSFYSIDYAKAHEFAKRAADQSINLIAQTIGIFHLGFLYYHGFGVDQNDKIAVEYLTRAANQQNYPLTQRNALQLLNKYFAARRKAGVGIKQHPNHQHPAPKAGSEPPSKKQRT